MNKQDGNMYEFVTHTSNPIKGVCPHDCSYCYMKSIYNRFNNLDRTVRLDQDELNCNYGRGRFIFMGSSTDMFATEIPTEWITQVYDHCLQYDKNGYLFQSKNPTRFLEPALIGHPLMQRKDIVYFCTTLETNREQPVVSKAESMNGRVIAMQKLRELGFRVMVTMEPIMDFDLNDVVSMLGYIQPFQVNIGCNTSRSVHLPEPSREKILGLVNTLRQFTNVKLKSNSSRILGDLSEIKEPKYE